ncbi:MAG TPA: hypothetical protein VM120_07630 [Bryobacteraceae bacterium]|nr:hypothetical protein [Bryobacteraceae bacterium]
MRRNSPLSRRDLLAGAGGLAAGTWLLQIPGMAQGPAPLPEPHFPDRLHLFVWRNWEIVNIDRIARVAGATPDKILELGASMGLPRKPQLSNEQLRRIYITVIRQNWHLLPQSQLIELLEWTHEKLEFTLKEDDFLSHKLGPKPDCPKIVYSEPSAEARRRSAEIRGVLKKSFGAGLGKAGEEPFAFVGHLSDQSFSNQRDPKSKPSKDQVDISGWAVQSPPGEAAAPVDRFQEYLRAAMAAPAGTGKSGRIEFRLSPNEVPAGGFRIEVSGTAVTVAAPTAFHPAVSWLQDRMEEAGGPFLPRGHFELKPAFDLRYLYSYFALYGDPLLEPDIDPFPDGYLEKLTHVGINGVWMQAVLSTLAPAKEFPEFGEGAATRLANLRKLVNRASRYGLKVYLYINEPRSQTPEFFRNRAGIRGASRGGFYCMCTAAKEVQDWLSGSLAHVFKEVPGLGGVFTISMSENLTNCFSTWTQASCPRCRERKVEDALSEVAWAIRDGVRRSSKDAEVNIWDWGWPPWGPRRDTIGPQLVPKLPTDIRLQSVSEWDLPVEHGGVKTRVGEYSISNVGPGPRAKAIWRLARERGIRTMAKTQFNNTWEISAVPYIPVPYLIARHCSNLRREGVRGIQASWTLGGYPSPNLAVAKEFYFEPSGGIDEILARVAARRYGSTAAPHALRAWKAFSEAFEEFPYGVHVYVIPTQHGPANMLRAKETGVKPSMILLPQDDLDMWRGPYPAEVVRDQFLAMARGWRTGLEAFRRAVSLAPKTKSAMAREDLAIAEVCRIHFQSVANQVEFYRLRSQPESTERRSKMRELVEAEIALACELYPLARRYSVLAYEATNHYYYRPLDLAEAVLRGRYLLEREL